MAIDSILLVLIDHQVNSYYNNPNNFYFIERLVDQDNSHLVNATKQELQTLDYKAYGFIV